MKHLYKYYKKIRNGDKIPRKYKKYFLGEKLSKTQIKNKIKMFKVIHHQKHIYEPTETNIPFFCPWCGCTETRNTGNMVEYPELWERVYCLRCGKMVAEADNSTYFHVIEHILSGEDGDRIESLKALWCN